MFVAFNALALFLLRRTMGSFLPKEYELEAGHLLPGLFSFANRFAGVTRDQIASEARTCASAEASAKIQSWKRRSARPRSADCFETK